LTAADLTGVPLPASDGGVRPAVSGQDTACFACLFADRCDGGGSDGAAGLPQHRRN